MTGKEYLDAWNSFAVWHKVTCGVFPPDLDADADGCVVRCSVCSEARRFSVPSPAAIEEIRRIVNDDAAFDARVQQAQRRVIQ